MSLTPYLYDFERPFHMLPQEFFRPNRFYGHPLFHPTPRDFYGSRHRMNWENALRPISQIERLMMDLSQLACNEPGINITSDNQKFQVNVDVQHFTPQEITVTVIDGQVVVEGKHEEKQDEHGYVSRHFIRKYPLPQGCLPDTVESKLSSDGVLTVTAPKVLAMPSTGERIVPISHTGPVQKQAEGA